MTRFLEEPADRSKLIAKHEDDSVAIGGNAAILDHQEVAVQQELVRQRVALDAQRIQGATHGERWRQRDALRRTNRLERTPAGDLAEQGHLDARGWIGIHQLDSTTLVLCLANVSLLHELLDVLVHRGRRRQAEVRADLFERRRVSLILQIAADIVENLLLALCQIHDAQVEAVGARTPLTVGQRRPNVKATRWYPGSMVYLCLDMGTRRIGVAVSDPTGLLARPIDTLPGGEPAPQFAQRLRPLVRDHEAEKLVIGLPKRLDGARGPEAIAVETIAAELQELLGMPVILWDERLSTVEATRRLIESGVRPKRRKQLVDQVAAALILQSYLDALDDAPVHQAP